MKETGNSSTLPLILLSGDNARTSDILHRALLHEGFQVQLAPTYDELESLWQQQQHVKAPIVLLEVSGAEAVESAVRAALQLKRCDPLMFVGYLADPVLHTSGLAGDAVFTRNPGQVAKALRNQFSSQA